MAGKSLSDLADTLRDEPMPILNADDLPDFGTWAPPPQPGPYRFKLPPDLTKIWEPYEETTTNGKSSQYVRAIFDKDAPLQIIRSVGGKHNLEPFHTRLSNQPRKRGTIEASDLQYLLKATGDKVLPGTNRECIEAVQTKASHEFDADLTYSWTCSEKRNAYVPDPEDKTATKSVKSDRMGCGATYRQADQTKKAEQKIEKVNGEYPYEITCRCGAVVRAFANLTNLRA